MEQIMQRVPLSANAESHDSTLGGATPRWGAALQLMVGLLQDQRVFKTFRNTWGQGNFPARATAPAPQPQELFRNGEDIEFALGNEVGQDRCDVGVGSHVDGFLGARAGSRMEPEMTEESRAGEDSRTVPSRNGRGTFGKLLERLQQKSVV